MAAAAMTPAQTYDWVRGHINFAVNLIVGTVFWVAVIALKVVFVATVAKYFGYKIPFVPTPAELTLVYLAGVVYLISKA